MEKGVIGHLLVSVRCGGGSSPIAGASLEVSLNGRGGGLYFTDLSGKTELIGLEADGGYYLRAEAPLFEGGEYGPIPIIGGVTTLQNVELFPSFMKGRGER